MAFQSSWQGVGIRSFGFIAEVCNGSVSMLIGARERVCDKNIQKLTCYFASSRHLSSMNVRSSLNKFASLGATGSLALVAVSATALLNSCNSKTESTVADKSETIELSKPKAAPVNVLYVTHEPGRYHDYTYQRKQFEKLAASKGWKLTVMSGSHDEVEQKLATDKDFGAGSDVIVYNMCMAHCANPEVPHNIMQQTQKKGIPAILTHCSLHSFWPTFKEKGENAIHPGDAHAKVHTRKDLLAEWKTSHPGEAFPAWPNFTGLASTSHSPQGFVKCTILDAEHPSVSGVSDFTSVKGEELYYNFINEQDSPQSKLLMKGEIETGQTAVVLWENPFSSSKVISFSLGHDSEQWNQAEFLKVLENSVEYLAEDESK